MGLKEFRKKEGLTQGDLAAVLKEHGYECSKVFVSNIENGIKKPPFELMVAFKESFPEELIDDVFFDAIAIRKVKNSKRDISLDMIIN